MLTYKNGFYAVCPTGLQEVLHGELSQLGAKNVEISGAGVHFDGDQELLYRANLCLRTASKVLVPIKEFACSSEVMLYDQIKRLKWETLLDEKSTFVVECVLFSSRLTHSHFIELKVKDAIVDRMRERCGGQRPSIDKQDPDIKIHLFINNNRCTLSLDSSGDSLHRRGYRPHGTAAPLKENLAAGLLMLAGYDGSEPLFDPMCGSATFLLEAAMIARHIAPGLLREVPFGFQHWPDFDRDLLSQVFDEAESKILPQAPQPIVGMERDRKAYGLARTAIANAGLSEDIRVSLADAFQQSEGSHMKADHGLVITNPPYGVRLEFEDEARVVAIHKRLGDLFKKQFSGWRGAVITASDAGAKSIGLKPKRRFPVKNGGLDSRFMIYELYQGTKRRHNVEA